MTEGFHTVAAATAAVLINGTRVGSAVLVDGRHLLTAAHVLRQTRVSATASDEVTVIFPGHGGRSTPLRARRLFLPEAEMADIAVLDLGDGLSAALPRPVEVCPARKAAPRVSVLGFPRAEARLSGVWRTFDVGGPVAGGALQLDWASGTGTLPGHSGGPVVTAMDTSLTTSPGMAVGSLVGVLVEGSQVGKFDRFVPIDTIARCWPSLQRPWLMGGAEGKGHFERRSLGQRSRVRGGDLFRGRARALSRVRDWLTASRAPGAPLVVIGQPGAGKSSVLARAVVVTELGNARSGVAFHARGATHLEFLQIVADLCGHTGSLSTDALLDTFAEQGADTEETIQYLVAVDALNEASSSADRQAIARTVSEIAALPGLRVAVATRPLASGNRYTMGALLPELGVFSPHSQALVDLDSDEYFDPEGLLEFSAATLSQAGAARPGPNNAAWLHYRDDPALCRRLAHVIAEKSGRNYLVAAMAASPLSTAPDAVDPVASTFDPSTIPSGIGEALAKYSETLSDERRPLALGLLAALAYARGDGISDHLWLQFAGALGYKVDMTDIDRLRDSAAADYLLQSGIHGQERVTRLFHQALNDEFLADRPRRSDEHAVLAALRRHQGHTHWAAASTYAQQHAADHAFASGDLPALLEDVQYLAVADLRRLLSLLSFGSPAATTPCGILLLQAGARASSLSRERRVGLLALGAAQLGLRDLHEHLVATSSAPIKPIWAHPLGTPHRELTGHNARVAAVAIGRVEGRVVIVSGSWDATVRVWDAGTGQPIGEGLTGHSTAVSAVAIGRIGARDVIVSGGGDGAVRVWDAGKGTPIGRPLVAHDGWVDAVAIGRIGDREVILSGGEDALVWIWDAVSLAPFGAPLTGHTSLVSAVSLIRSEAGDIIVSGSGDATVRVWDSVTRKPIYEPLIGHEGLVSTLITHRFGARDLVISGGTDGTVRSWDIRTGRSTGEPLATHSDAVDALAIGQIGERAVIVVAGGDNATIQVYEAESGEPIGEPLAGDTNAVDTVAVGRVGDRDIIVSGGDDAIIRVWDAGTGQSAGDPLTGHTRSVESVAIGRVGSKTVVVSGGGDATIRISDAATGGLIGDPLVGHMGAVNSVAIGRLRDEDIVVSGGWDATVRVWNPLTGREASTLRGHTSLVSAVAIGQVGGKSVVVSGSRDTTIRVWEVAQEAMLLEPLVGHADAVSAVTLCRIEGCDLIVSGSWDNTIRIWDAATGNAIGDPLIGHTDSVQSVAVGSIGDRGVIVSGGADQTVRVWDMRTRQALGSPLIGHTGPVAAVSIGRAGNQQLILSGGADEKLRIWDATRLIESYVLDLPGRVSSCAMYAPDLVVATTGRAVAAFCLAELTT